MQQIAADKLQTPMSHTRRKANFAPQTAVQTFGQNSLARRVGMADGVCLVLRGVLLTYFFFLDFSVNKHAELLAKTTDTAFGMKMKQHAKWIKG